MVAVQHASNERQSAIDLKNSIAAAFQANFGGTEEEIESDPQSEHIAHYRYLPNNICLSHNNLIHVIVLVMNKIPTILKKMHRHINGDDVIYYSRSSGAKKKNIKLFKDEDIEYRDGLYSITRRVALCYTSSKKKMKMQ